MKILKALIIVPLFSIGFFGGAQTEKETRTQKFNLIDVDGNEVITIREMRTFYKGKTDIEGEPINGKKLFYGLDANKNSIITLNEYLVGVDLKLAYEFEDKWRKRLPPGEERSESELLAEKKSIKFKNIDKDKNAELNFSELADFYKGVIDGNTGEPINCRLVFYAYDQNNDDKITLLEYMGKPDWDKGASDLKLLESGYESKDEDELPLDYVNQRIEIFFAIDIDKNYKITKAEMVAYYEGKLNNAGKPVNAELQFYGLDTDEDGVILIEEFAKKIDFKYASSRLREAKQE